MLGESEYTIRNGSVEIEDLSKIITPDSFLEMGLDEIPPYISEGRSSTKDIYDNPKTRYIKEQGVEIPEDWDRAFNHTAYAILISIGAFRRMVNDNVDSATAWGLVMHRLIEKRIDNLNYRSVVNLESRKRFGEYIGDQGGSNNPELRVRPDEFLQIFKRIHDSLSEKELEIPTV